MSSSVNTPTVVRVTPGAGNDDLAKPPLSTSTGNHPAQPDQAPKATQTDSKPLSHEPAQPQPIKPAAATAAPAQVSAAPPPPTIPVQKTLADYIMERFVSVEDLRGGASHFPFRGLCLKCGWQTYQFDEAAARQLVFNHAQSHWRDVSGLVYNP